MTAQRISVLIIEFNNQLPISAIPKFRGAVINMLNSKNILFHNHREEGGLRYSYPLIQYKRIHGKAAIVCVAEGTESIGEFFSNRNETVKIGNKEAPLELAHVKADKVLVQLWESEFTYSLRKWLPFNQENYAKFQEIEDVKGKAEFLEKILTGNILSFAKGIGIRFDANITGKITSIEEMGAMKYKDIPFAAFDILFKTNVSLPNYIGLGKGVSHGFGMVVRIKSNETKI
ncbi:MAG: hypothetical protein LBT78_08830 [Tannerella sp.]|jgi:hypothetical protein|nr:hypothetical protein [Tannerella sp.]